MIVYLDEKQVDLEEWPDMTTPHLAYQRDMVQGATALLHGFSWKGARLDPEKPRLTMSCPTSRGGSGQWVPTRSSPRFLDQAWEVIQRSRLELKAPLRVLGYGPHTEDTIVRYPWDAIVCPRVSVEVIQAHKARWKNRWWP